MLASFAFALNGQIQIGILTKHQSEPHQEEFKKYGDNYTFPWEAVVYNDKGSDNIIRSTFTQMKTRPPSQYNGMTIDVSDQSNLDELKKLVARAIEIGEKMVSAKDLESKVILVTDEIKNGTKSIWVSVGEANESKALYAVYRFGDEQESDTFEGLLFLQGSTGLKQRMDAFEKAVSEFMIKQARLKKLYGIK